MAGRGKGTITTARGRIKHKSLSAQAKVDYAFKIRELIETPLKDGYLLQSKNTDKMTPLEIGALRLVHDLMDEKKSVPALRFIYERILGDIEEAAKIIEAQDKLKEQFRPLIQRARLGNLSVEDFIAWVFEFAPDYIGDKDTTEIFMGFLERVFQMLYRAKDLELKREMLAYSRINSVPYGKVDAMIHLFEETMKRHMAVSPDALERMGEELYTGLAGLFPAFQQPEASDG